MNFALSKLKKRDSWAPLLLGSTGILIALILWDFFTGEQFLNKQFSKGFSPENTFSELLVFFSSGSALRHIVPSLERVFVGLLIAFSLGVPLGLVVGLFKPLNLLTAPVFQFARMTSPLAWIPIAIIIFGIGSKPIYFLIAMAAVWPIVINTAHGVQTMDPIWSKVVQSLGGKMPHVLYFAVIPGMIPNMLTGVRIAIGVSWIVLVPAEMLGVASGLGYSILDARDRFNYGELMAIILIVGALGFLSDALVRVVQRKFSWNEMSDE